MGSGPRALVLTFHGLKAVHHDDYLTDGETFQIRTSVGRACELPEPNRLDPLTSMTQDTVLFLSTAPLEPPKLIVN